MVVGGCSVNGPTVSGSLKSFLSTSYLVGIELLKGEMLSQGVLSLLEASLEKGRDGRAALSCPLAFTRCIRSAGRFFRGLGFKFSPVLRSGSCFMLPKNT
jgi:hypothetical protein